MEARRATLSTFSQPALAMEAAMAACESCSARDLVLHDLDLLQHIFGYLELQELVAVVPRVCKAFHAAQSTSGSCWASLEIDGLRLTHGPPVAADAAARFWASLAAWLPRRAGALRTLRLANLRHLLQQLEPPARLAALTGLWAALASSTTPAGAASAAALPARAAVAAPALRSIEIGPSSISLPQGTLAGMACLGQLRSLRLHSASFMECSELDALAAGLPLLEELVVCLMRRRGEFCGFRGPFPRGLTELPRLRRLRLEAPYSALNAATCVLPDCIRGWGGQMEALHLVNLGLEALPPAIGALTGLQELCLGRNRLGLCPGGVPWELTMLTALTRLELQYNGFDAGPPPAVGELPALAELNLSGNLWGSRASDLPHEYAQLSALKYLTLTNCELSSLPPVVAGLSSLVLLKLNINLIQTLPPGPYLRSLEILDLGHNRFRAGYPPALAAASRLQLLAFQWNGVHYSDPKVALLEALAPADGAVAEEGEEGPALVPAALAGGPAVTAVPLGVLPAEQAVGGP